METASGHNPTKLWELNCRRYASQDVARSIVEEQAPEGAANHAHDLRRKFEPICR
jgi:hypothetical protein